MCLLRIEHVHIVSVVEYQQPRSVCLVLQFGLGLLQKRFGRRREPLCFSLPILPSLSEDISPRAAPRIDPPTMRLLQRNHDGRFTLTEFTGDAIPHYAILSHTWGADIDEVTLADLEIDTDMTKADYKKLHFCADQASKDDVRYFWVDTCCIDKTSSAELTEASNPMFKWYRKATQCYAYLSNVSTGGLCIGRQHGSLLDLAAVHLAHFSAMRVPCWNSQSLISAGVFTRHEPPNPTRTLFNNTTLIRGLIIRRKLSVRCTGRIT
jgi:hypothetical protein